MPGGRPISGGDVRAALRYAGAPREAERALAEAVRPDDLFASYEELRAACPPERIGLSSGAHAAALAPLFGEFE